MRASEILRDLADQLLLDKISNLSKIRPAKPTVSPQPVAQPQPVQPGQETDQPDDIMIPPLQLKLELLKKATGVENVFTDNDQGDKQVDELNSIRKNAGIAINPVTLDALGDDEPLDV